MPDALKSLTCKEFIGELSKYKDQFCFYEYAKGHYGPQIITEIETIYLHNDYSFNEDRLLAADFIHESTFAESAGFHWIDSYFTVGILLKCECGYPFEENKVLTSHKLIELLKPYPSEFLTYVNPWRSKQRAIAVGQERP